MERIGGVKKQYAWGSDTTIQEHFDIGEPGETLAEVWFGAHRLSPSALLSDEPADPISLVDWISADPEGTLGVSVVEHFGARSPYLTKLIVPKRPLSLQAHPDREHAQSMFDAEGHAGIPLDAAQHMYKDPNYKSELIYASTRFEALAGFRAPRHIVEIFPDLDTELATQIVSQLRAQPSPESIQEVADRLLSPHTTPAAPQVETIMAAISDRLQAGVSSSVRVDRVVASLAHQYPGDAGTVVAVMPNPISLRPGEVLFAPPGGIHAYVSGLGVKIMANSDNVLRAGLTEKHVDCQELLNCLDRVAAPPVRTAPGWVTDPTQVFYAPVDDFELSVMKLGDLQLLPGHGGRIMLCTEDEAILSDAEIDQLCLLPGQAMLARADKTPVCASGRGVVM